MKQISATIEEQAGKPSGSSRRQPRIPGGPAGAASLPQRDWKVPDSQVLSMRGLRRVLQDLSSRGASRPEGYRLAPRPYDYLCIGQSARRRSIVAFSVPSETLSLPRIKPRLSRHRGTAAGPQIFS